MSKQSQIMKPLNEVIENFNLGCLDERDATRLAEFVPEDQLAKIGCKLKDEAKGTWQPKEWTRENILAQLKLDVEFGFEKALNQRGISSSMMYSVVQMWNKILEEGLEDFDEYAQYGLPLFKATAVKYGFDNPIGDDTGTESEYAG